MGSGAGRPVGVFWVGFAGSDTAFYCGGVIRGVPVDGVKVAGPFDHVLLGCGEGRQDVAERVFERLGVV